MLNRAFPPQSQMQRAAVDRLLAARQLPDDIVDLLAEIGAMEFLYPIRLRRSDLRDFSKSDGLSYMSARYGVPEDILATHLNDNLMELLESQI